MSDAKVARARADREASTPASPPQPATQAVAMEQLTVTISSTGRPFAVAIPADMTDGELLEVVGWMGTALRQHIAARRMQTAGGRIILPGRPA